VNRFGVDLAGRLDAERLDRLLQASAVCLWLQLDSQSGLCLHLSHAGPLTIGGGLAVAAGVVDQPLDQGSHDPGVAETPGSVLPPGHPQLDQSPAVLPAVGRLSAGRPPSGWWVGDQAPAAGTVPLGAGR
jgi:hypothetical protein